MLLEEAVDRLWLLDVKLEALLKLEYEDDVESVDELSVLEVLRVELDSVDWLLLLRLDLLLALLNVELTVDVLVLVVTVFEEEELTVDAEETEDCVEELALLGVRLDELDTVLSLLGVALLYDDDDRELEEVLELESSLRLDRLDRLKLLGVLLLELLRVLVLELSVLALVKVDDRVLVLVEALDKLDPLRELFVLADSVWLSELPELGVALEVLLLVLWLVAELELEDRLVKEDSELKSSKPITLIPFVSSHKSPMV